MIYKLIHICNFVSSNSTLKLKMKGSWESSLTNSGKIKFYEKLFICLIMHQQDVTDKIFPTGKNMDILMYYQ